MALECPTKLYYADRPNIYENQRAEDQFLKALAEGGKQVEALAQAYFPEGILINDLDVETALLKTDKLLNQERAVIFEAAFSHDNCLVRVDILIKTGQNLKVLEVKAKSMKDDEQFETQKGVKSKWKPYIADVGYQKYIVKKAKPNFNVTASLFLVDKSQKCPTDKLNQKFLLLKDPSGRPKVKVTSPITKEDLEPKLLREVKMDLLIDSVWQEQDKYGVTLFDNMKLWIDKYTKGLKASPIIKKECGRCQFKGGSERQSGLETCLREALAYNDEDMNEPNIFELWNNRSKDKQIEKGIIKLKDLTEDEIPIKPSLDGGISPTERQWIQIEKAITNDGSIWVDKKGLVSEIKSWRFPYHFIDFEIAMLPIPLKKGQYPYQGLAFQFSHHVMDANGDVRHAGEYLNDEIGIDPNINFIRALKHELENDMGTVFMYSSHENTFLNFILSQVENDDSLEDKDALIGFIKTITKPKNDRRHKWCPIRPMIELLEVVKKYYYNPKTKGSNSIKKVLPAILDSSQYVRNRYMHPIYGATDGIYSKNFKNHQWLKYEGDKLQDPYSQLDPIHPEANDKELEYLFDADYLKEGGSATIAYIKMQYTEMSDAERSALAKSLLRYCELDTLAMVMIVEEFLNIGDLL